MADRRDALLAAARVVQRANELAHELGGLVTVGRLDVRPNSRAVVPGEVTLIVDIRDPDAAKIDAIDDAVRAGIAAIAADAGVDADVRVALEIPAVAFDTECGDAIRRACAKLGLSSASVISGAAPRRDEHRPHRAERSSSSSRAATGSAITPPSTRAPTRSARAATPCCTPCWSERVTAPERARSASRRRR